MRAQRNRRCCVMPVILLLSYGHALHSDVAASGVVGFPGQLQKRPGVKPPFGAGTGDHGWYPGGGAGTKGVGSESENVNGVAHRKLLQQSDNFTCEGCVCGGFAHACAVKTNGKLGCWGENKENQAAVPAGWSTNMSMVGCGYNHACAVSRIGDLNCWGSNDAGQTNIPDDFKYDIAWVTGGWHHTCAITKGGDFGCWGDNSHNQTSIPEEFSSDVRSATAGLKTTCALRNDGELGCWGGNADGDSYIPSGWSTNVSVVQGSDDDTICAMRDNGDMNCWGENKYGKADIPSAWSTGIVDVSPGIWLTCATKEDGSFFCWGHGTVLEQFSHPVSLVATGGAIRCFVFKDAFLDCLQYGEYIFNPMAMQSFWNLTDDSSGPPDAPPGPVASIVPEEPPDWCPNRACVCAGSQHACAVKSNGQLGCWGSNNSGQAAIPFGWSTNIAMVSCGHTHTCAISRQGDLNCWGMNDYNQTNILNDFKHDITEVISGVRHTCAIRGNGDFGCWGDNSDNQTSVPEEFSSNVKHASTGWKQTCAVRDDGEMGCWGWNTYGETDIPSGWSTNVSVVRGVDNTMCALRDNGNMACWGANEAGDTVIPSGWDLGVVDVSPGVQHTCVLRKDGAAMCRGRWEDVPYLGGDLLAIYNGQNIRCALDVNGSLACIAAKTALPKLNPTPPPNFEMLQDDATLLEEDVPSGPSALPAEPPDWCPTKGCVCVGLSHACAVNSTGILGCWGDDTHNQSSVPPDWSSNIAMVGCGHEHTCAISREGDLNCWGLNDYNQTIVPDDFKHNITWVTGGTWHTCAVTIDGDLGCWGDNWDGQSSVPEEYRSDVRSVATGWAQTCAVRYDGEMGCWGSRTHGELDIPSGWSTNVNVVKGSDDTMCALRDNGDMACWGQNDAGDAVIPAGWDSGIVDVSPGMWTTCAVRQDGKSRCWGDWPDLPSVPDTTLMMSNSGWFKCAVSVSGDVACISKQDEANATVPVELQQLEDPTSPVPPPSGGGVSVAAVVVPIVVVVAVATVALGLALMLRKRRRRTAQQSDAQVDSATAPKGVTKVKYKCPRRTPLDGPPLESEYASLTPGASSSETTDTTTESNKQNCRAAAGVIAADSVFVFSHPDGSYELLGEGAYSKVYRGEWDGHLVALKQLKAAADVHDRGNLSAMMKEMNLVKQCAHENIVQMHGVVLEDDMLLVFELMEGGDLFHALRKSTSKLRWYDRGKDIAIHIAQGIAYLHSKPIVHCDIKSSNVLLTKDGVAKIADLGMAKLMLTDLVTKGNQMGTWAYAAPELVLESRISTMVDIYSFGVVLWEIVTGEVPERGAMRKPSVPQECPEMVFALIQSCMEVNPDDRPSAIGLLAILNNC